MTQVHDTSRLVAEGVIKYLEESKLKSLLPEVEEILEEKTKGEKQVKEIIVRSAILLSKDELDRIKDVVTKTTGVDVPLVNRIEKDIIGGFTIRAGDWYLDASIRRDLTDLGKILLS